MNPLSDSLMTPLTGASSRGASPLGLGDGVNTDSPGAGDPGTAGGFAAVLDRVQDGRAADETGAANEVQAPALSASGVKGDVLADAALVDAQAAQQGAGRQGMAAAFAAQWAALLPGGDGKIGSPAAESAKQRATEGAQPGAGAQDAMAATNASDADVAVALASSGVKRLPLAEYISGPAALGSKGSEEAVKASSPDASEADAAAADARAATDGAAAALPFIPVPPVVALQISPQLSVITAGQPTSSDESLRAYAAAQGFDAAALQRMFGSAGAASVTAAGPASGMASGTAADTAAGTAAGMGAAAAGSAIRGAAPWWSAQMASTLPTSLSPSTPSSSASSSAPTAATTLDTPSASTGLASSLAASAGRAGGPESGAPMGLVQGLVGAAFMPSSVGKTNSSATNTASTGAKAPDSLAEALERFSAEGGRMSVERGGSGAASTLGDAARPFGGAGQGTGSGTGMGTGVAMAAASAGMAAATSAWWALQAREGFTPNAGATPVAGAAAAVEGLDAAPASAAGDAGPAPTSTMAGAIDNAAPAHKAQPASAARPVDAHPIDLRDHLEQSHEALSKRLGEALAARMIAQIEKGDWQIRLSVAPAHLGPIDIDLQMRGQRMDAQFQVAHGQTQALIQDGLPRLREAVGASGMDLASVWVSGGWNERNRGNPTPGQPNDPALLSLKEGGGDEPEVSGAPSVDSRGPGRAPRPGGVDILI